LSKQDVPIVLPIVAATHACDRGWTAPATRKSDRAVQETLKKINGCVCSTAFSVQCFPGDIASGPRFRWGARAVRPRHSWRSPMRCLVLTGGFLAACGLATCALADDYYPGDDAIPPGATDSVEPGYLAPGGPGFGGPGYGGPGCASCGQGGFGSYLPRCCEITKRHQYLPQLWDGYCETQHTYAGYMQRRQTAACGDCFGCQSFPTHCGPIGCPPPPCARPMPCCEPPCARPAISCEPPCIRPAPCCEPICPPPAPCRARQTWNLFGWLGGSCAPCDDCTNHDVPTSAEDLGIAPAPHASPSRLPLEVSVPESADSSEDGDSAPVPADDRGSLRFLPGDDSI
jgi:hypothetical protein